MSHQPPDLTARRPAGHRPFLAAVGVELGRIVAPPFEVLLIVALNAAMMAGAWFLLPRSWLFNMTGAAAFPVLLASWMYADVPATNTLAPDRKRALAALSSSDRDTSDHHSSEHSSSEHSSSEHSSSGWGSSDRATSEVVRLLRVKSAALWLVVTVPCLIASAVTGLVDQRPVATLATVVGVAVLPVGPLLTAGCLGLAFPYHQRALRWRWRHRRQWRRQLRWVLLVCAPYLVVPLLLGLTVWPSVQVWRLLGPPRGQLIPAAELFGLVALACATSAMLAVVGSRVAVLIVRRRRLHLIAYLVDIERG